MNPDPRQARSRHPRTRLVLATLLVLALVAAAAGFGFYRHLNRNIQSSALPSDVSGSETALTGLPDGVAQNIVVSGTDYRESEADCEWVAPAMARSSTAAAMRT